MAISPFETTYSIVREATSGVTPATPAFKYIDHVPGSELTFDGKMVNSEAKKVNRALVESVLLDQSGAGNLKVHFRRDTTVDMLIEAVLGGAFASNVAKGGNTRFSHSIDKVMVDNTSGSRVETHYLHTGRRVTKMSVSVAAGGNAEATFDFVGTGRSVSASAPTGATYTAPTQGIAYNAGNCGTIVIGGLNGVYTSMEFSIDNSADPVFGLGQANAYDVLSSKAYREIKTTVKMLRTSDNAIDNLAGTIVPVTITFGTGTGNQYIISMPRCRASYASDENASSAAVVSLDLTATDDAATGAEITITKA